MGKCETCQHWIEQGKNAMDLSAPKVGECHKGPPTALAVQVGAGQIQIMSAWPPTPANGGCGEHEFPEPAINLRQLERSTR